MTATRSGELPRTGRTFAPESVVPGVQTMSPPPPGFCWTDEDDDLVIDQMEEATIDHIDPWTGTWKASPIWQDEAGGWLYVRYGTIDAHITMSVKESPYVVPLPLSAWLAFPVLLVLGICRGARRRRHRPPR